MSDIKKSIEAVLFAAARAVSLEELTKLVGIKDENAIKKAARELKEELESKDSPIMVVEENNGWKLTVREKFLPTVQQIVPHTDLSRPILETLAVVAWKQPARQSEVVKYRGSTAYEHIKELEKLGYISREKQGRSFKVRVTNKFFEYFDLPKDKLKELFKDVKDVEEAAQKTIEAFKDNKEAIKHVGDEHLGNLEVYKTAPKEKLIKETFGNLEVFEEPSEEIEEIETEVEVGKEEEIPATTNNKTLSLAKKIVEESHESHEEKEETEEVEEKPKKKSEGRQLAKELEEDVEEES